MMEDMVGVELIVEWLPFWYLRTLSNFVEETEIKVVEIKGEKTESQ